MGREGAIKVSPPTDFKSVVLKYSVIRAGVKSGNWPKPVQEILLSVLRKLKLFCVWSNKKARALPHGLGTGFLHCFVGREGVEPSRCHHRWIFLLLWFAPPSLEVCSLDFLLTMDVLFRSRPSSLYTFPANGGTWLGIAIVYRRFPRV